MSTEDADGGRRQQEREQRDDGEAQHGHRVHAVQLPDVAKADGRIAAIDLVTDPRKLRRLAQIG